MGYRERPPDCPYPELKPTHREPVRAVEIEGTWFIYHVSVEPSPDRPLGEFVTLATICINNGGMKVIKNVAGYMPYYKIATPAQVEAFIENEVKLWRREMIDCKLQLILREAKRAKGRWWG